MSDQMTPERIAEIKARESLVRFRGPFWASTKDDGPSLNNGNILWRDDAGDVWVLAQVNMYIEKEIGDTFPLRDFLAHARADVPDLLAALEASERKVAEFTAYIQEYADEPCTYGDDCPNNAGTRHYTCDNCKARQLLNRVLSSAERKVTK
jgi:hypothetical protein